MSMSESQPVYIPRGRDSLVAHALDLCPCGTGGDFDATPANRG